MTLRLALGLGLALAPIIVAADGDACLSAAIEAHQNASALLSNGTIRLQTSGALELDFDRGRALLDRPRLLEDIQQAYAAGLPPGETAEFVVHQTQPGHYRFVNRRGQHSLIEEVHRAQLSNSRFALVLYVKGERWFGDFESLIRIDVRSEAKTGGCRFRVEVDAFPHSALLRGMVRLGPAKRFFERKMHEIADISLDVVNSLDQQPRKRELTLTHLKMP